MRIYKYFLIKNKFILVGLALLLIDFLGKAISGEPLFGGWRELDHFKFLSSLDFKLFSVAILLVTTFLLLSWINKELGEGRIRIFKEPEPEPESKSTKKILFWALSTQSSGKLEISSDGNKDGNKDNNKFSVDGIVLTGNLKEDIDLLTQKGCKWNWIQLLRALDRHIDSLKEIIVLGSKDLSEKSENDSSGDKKTSVRGSCNDFNDCRELIKLYFKNFQDVNIITEPIAFNELDGISEYITGEILKRTDRETDKIKYRDIVVDITGGTKEVSLAMASVTLSNNICIQYIDNNAGSKVCQINFIPKLEL